MTLRSSSTTALGSPGCLGNLIHGINRSYSREKDTLRWRHNIVAISQLNLQGILNDFIDNVISPQSCSINIKYICNI